MPSCTLPSLFSDHVGIFSTMSKFFRQCKNFSDNVGILPNMSHFQGGIFPSMSEFFPIPILYAGKKPLLVDGRDPGQSHAKKTLWVAVKIFL
jgi:hypothetical protein